MDWMYHDAPNCAQLRMAAPREPSPEVDAFFARNVRPGGSSAPELPRKR
jgi:hypothetical protein